MQVDKLIFKRNFDCRLIQSEIQHSGKQMILQRHHYVVRLLLKHLHKKCKHCGKEYLLAVPREMFWVPNKAGLTTETMIRQCLIQA